ncbi:MAG: ferritin [Candidatus Micrarchaeia archaeon]
MNYGYENDKISEKAKDLAMARQSLVEELQAIDWYRERIELTKNEELKKILEHNESEEKEHAAMLFQFLLKNDSVQKERYEHHD